MNDTPHPERDSFPTASRKLNALVCDPSRLQALRQSGMLDSLPEESFDSLTRLAAAVVDVPASFISIVDGDRDFYKSQTGFPAPLSMERELKSRTLCHYTLDSDAPLVIDDTHANPVWKAVPTVETLGVRAYIGVPLKIDGQTIGSFCVIDIKPRNWSAKELEIVKQLAISAGREIELRGALNTAEVAIKESRQLARAREEMVAVVAHDLRTPLQVLSLSTRVLQKATQGSHDATTARMVTAINVMKSMSEGLLSVTALLAPSASGRTMLYAAELMSDATDMMCPIAERAQSKLTMGAIPDAQISVDYAQMLRVMGNLIGNSLKYSTPGCEVKLSGRRNGDILSLSIGDNGKGMTEAEKSQAFERGWQGADAIKRGDGAGLGLSIVNSIVAEHGGTVNLESATGLGTTVTISLPCTD